MYWGSFNRIFDSFSYYVSNLNIYINEDSGVNRGNDVFEVGLQGSVAGRELELETQRESCCVTLGSPSDLSSPPRLHVSRVLDGCSSQVFTLCLCGLELAQRDGRRACRWSRGFTRVFNHFK